MQIMTPVINRAKTVHASGRPTTAIGNFGTYILTTAVTSIAVYIMHKSLRSLKLVIAYDEKVMQETG
jgi:hypothetical protein